MATKRKKRFMIDLQDYVCKEPWGGGENQCYFELMAAKNKAMPCKQLLWCPYGPLATAFPASSAEAQEHQLSEHRMPMTCSRTGRHCPASYLPSSEPDDYDPLAECWNPTTEVECNSCTELPEKCPRGESWRRHVMVGSQLLKGIIEEADFESGWDAQEFAEFLYRMCCEGGSASDSNA